MMIKYPRTMHLPWSEGVTSDDKIIKDLSAFQDQDIVITEKMDGENTSIYRYGIHARSLDSRHHVSRDWVKSFAATIAGDIPENWRVCGENLFAKHSIKYDNLNSFFYGFSIWNDDLCLSWDETLEWFELLNVEPVPVIFQGQFDLQVFDRIKSDLDLKKQEGYVVRLARSFKYRDFRECVAKFVRPDHVQTSQHWSRQQVVANKLSAYARSGES